jgi:hypothetical protein
MARPMVLIVAREARAGARLLTAVDGRPLGAALLPRTHR